MEPVIRVSNLVRCFEDVVAVDDVSFDVERGRVVGFIGANGAGKTTTMRMMVTLDEPTDGTIEICGRDVLANAADIRQRVGWMPDAYGAYANVTVVEYLDFMARAFGFTGKERKERVDDVMSFTDLVSIADREMNRLSKGMAQRLCLGRALLNDPEVLVLDEPAAGLDPKARADFKRLVRLLAADEKTIFISSHILSELAEMCDALLFIDAGRIVYDGEPDALLNGEKGWVTRIEVANAPAALVEWVDLNAGVEIVETTKKGAIVRFDPPEAEHVSATLARMTRDGLMVTEFSREQARLEDAFIEMLKKVEVDA
jgi:ABC-2 type transport system ATP-binding protein